MALRQCVRAVFLPHLGAQKIAEKRVKAKPVPVSVHRIKKQSPIRQAIQQGTASRAAQFVIDQFCTEPIGQAYAEQRFARFGILQEEDFLSKIIDHLLRHTASQRLCCALFLRSE